jgi:hypothetical protein
MHQQPLPVAVQASPIQAAPQQRHLLVLLLPAPLLHILVAGIHPAAAAAPVSQSVRQLAYPLLLQAMLVLLLLVCYPPL